LAAFSSYILALAPKFCTKNAGVNIDEIDGRQSSLFAVSNSFDYFPAIKWLSELKISSFSAKQDFPFRVS